MSIGYDKSEYQRPGAGPFGDFEIIRAGNGRRRDYQWRGHVDAARARGIPISLYLYCEPSSTSPEFQADLLAGVAREAGIAATLWADIEEGGGDLRWFEDRFVARVNGHGFPCGTYSGDYFWGAHLLQGFQGRWKAAYGSNDGRMHTAPRQPWDIWQYTSNPLDTNTADPAVVGRLFGGAAAPAQPQRRRRNAMLVRDAESGAIWLLGVGAAKWVMTTQEVAEFQYVLQQPDISTMHPLLVIAWMQKFGAWVYGDGTPENPGFPRAA